MVTMRKNTKNEDEDADADEEEEGYASSHDLLAGLLVMAMERGKSDLNEARRTMQMRLTSELITSLEKAAEAQTPSADVLYAACVRFTAEYVHAFNDPGQGTPMVRFVGMEQVVRGDKVHQACCSWSAAQDIQHEAVESRRRNASEWGALAYPELLLAHAQRVVAV